MIRIQNIDGNLESTRLHQQIMLGDFSATRIVTMFVAPTDIVIRRLDFYTLSNNTFNDSQTSTITVRLASASGSTLGVLSTALSASARNVMTVSSNNSLTMGTLLQFVWSSTCQVLSSVMVDVAYTPQRHKRANR